jgi:Ubiquitin carboxyl-terminal hydrolase, family 1
VFVWVRVFVVLCFVFSLSLALALALFPRKDAWGLDETMLSFQPQPVLAVIFLFPTSKCCRDKSANVVKSDDVWFMKQLVGNACGTVAVVHALANNRDAITLKGECSDPLCVYAVCVCVCVFWFSRSLLCSRGSARLFICA